MFFHRPSQRAVVSDPCYIPRLWVRNTFEWKLCEWITQTLRIFLCTKRFSTKLNFEAIGKCKRPLIRNFTFIWIKIFKQLLCSTFKPPLFCCFPFFPCLFKIIVQCLFHQWKPQSTASFWFTRFYSCLSHSPMRFMSTLNFLEAEELFLSFSEDHYVTDNLNSRLYDFLSAVFILNKPHVTPRKHSKNEIFKIRMLNLTWWHSIALTLWVENMALREVKLVKISFTFLHLVRILEKS